MDRRWQRVYRRSNVGLVLCVLLLRSSYNHYTGNFPVNARACSDLRCLKYFLSTVQGSFIDSCACAMFKTLERPNRHGAGFDQQCNIIILLKKISKHMMI